MPNDSAQLNLFIETDEKIGKKYKFFCALNKSADGKVLVSNPLQWSQKIRPGTRLVVERHREKGSPYSEKRTWRYCLFLDESRTDPLPRRNGSEVQNGKTTNKRHNRS